MYLLAAHHGLDSGHKKGRVSILELNDTTPKLNDTAKSFWKVILDIPIGGRLTTYSYNALNGSLTALSLNTGDAPGGIMVAYAP